MITSQGLGAHNFEAFYSSLSDVDLLWYLFKSNVPDGLDQISP